MDNLLNLYLDTKNTLETNINPELEVKFATRGKKKISKLEFDNVIKYLLSMNFNYIDKNKYYLRIITDDIRTEIKNLSNIQKFCRTNKIDTENDYINFNIKNLYDTTSNVNIDNFNFRLSYNLETKLNIENPKIQTLLENWESVNKFYRLINRFTLEHVDFPFKIDLSIIKQSNKIKKNLKLTDNIFELNEQYEIEIEINNNKIKDTNAVDLEIMLKKVIKYVMSGLQETNYPIGISEINNIQIEYYNLIKGKDYVISKIEPKDFIGPSSSTLQLSNISVKNEDSDIVNIRDNYTVTDKADGERKLLFISSTGKIYLIITNINIQFTGSYTKNKELYNTLIDGEHILYNKLNEFINLYAAFDIYFIKNNDVRKLEFVPNEGDETIKNKFRLPLLTNVIMSLDSKLIGTNKLSPIRIELKKFYQTNRSNNIFKACSNIINNRYEYETDGMIFTPKNLGVGINSLDDKIKSNRVTWKYSLKWKPAEFNTIDFLITIKKTSTGADYIGTIFNKGLKTNNINQITQYKTVILRVGFDENKHGYLNPCQNIIDDNFPKYNYNEDRNQYKPVQFFPSNPYDSEAGIANILLKLDSNNNKVMFTENNEIIEDNTIVEFKYVLDYEKGWRWVPLRVRYDKTAEFRNGFKNYGNAYHVAQSNWYSIHNPITIEMLTTGNNIPEELIDDDIYYNKYKGPNLTKSLRDFHNLYVKRKIIQAVSNSSDTLIDYAVGKGGDLPKWINAKLKFVFGIDLSKDNIENRLDGACARYLNYKKKFKNLPDAIFINGTANKNIKSLNSQFNDKAKQITKSIFGEGINDEKILGKGISRLYGIVKEGFNISSIQFALHYMFESKDTLNQFLLNLAECTKLGGYFIGTSYDGNKIFNLLKSKQQNESLIIKDKNSELNLLEITKLYDSDIFKDDSSSLGYSINVFQESINKTFKEYLVNYKYLNKILEDYGFIQLTNEELKEKNLNSSVGDFSDLFELMNNEIKKSTKKSNEFGSALSMSNELKQISFLNKYFIYKKVRNINIDEISSILKDDKLIEEEIKESKKIISEEQKELKQETTIKKKKTKTKLKIVS